MFSCTGPAAASNPPHTPSYEDGLLRHAEKAELLAQQAFNIARELRDETAVLRARSETAEAHARTLVFVSSNYKTRAAVDGDGRSIEQELEDLKAENRSLRNQLSVEREAHEKSLKWERNMCSEIGADIRFERDCALQILKEEGIFDKAQELYNRKKQELRDADEKKDTK